MAKCTRCGTYIPDNAAFCANCGEQHHTRKPGKLSRSFGCLAGFVLLLGFVGVGGYLRWPSIGASVEQLARQAQQLVLDAAATVQSPKEPAISLAPTHTSIPTAEPSTTPAPTDSPTSTPVPTPTATPAPTETPTATATSAPTETPIQVTGPFAELWRFYNWKLGKPLPGNHSPRTYPAGTFTEAPFSDGHMILANFNPKRVWIVSSSRPGDWTGIGTWQEKTITQTVSPDYTCASKSNYSLRGEIAWVWCNDKSVQIIVGSLAGPMRDAEAESSTPGVYLMQEFELGFVFRDGDGFTYGRAFMFFKNHSYMRQPVD